MVDEVTQMGFAARLAFPVYKPRTFLSPGYQDNLGWGFATALGAQDARRDVPVVSISGDGGFMFTANEMATAVRHRIPLTTIVFNDGAFGNVRRIQQEKFGNRLIASDLANPDFVKFAESFGAAGERARTPGRAARRAAAGLRPPRRPDPDRGAGRALPLALAVYLHAAGAGRVKPGDMSLGAAILTPLCKPGMELITTTEELATTCERLARHPFVTIDTEFLRETTYYPLLCVAQLASQRRGRGDRRAGARHRPQAVLRADGEREGAQGVPRRPPGHRNRLASRQASFRIRSSTPRSPPWCWAMAIPSPTTSWCSASPATRSTSRTASPTGPAGRCRRPSSPTPSPT